MLAVDVISAAGTVTGRYLQTAEEALSVIRGTLASDEPRARAVALSALEACQAQMDMLCRTLGIASTRVRSDGAAVVAQRGAASNPDR